MRASIRRLHELTDHETREPRRSITALAEAAAAAAAAAEEARRAVEEAQRAEEREQEARRLRAELLSVLRTPEKVDCGLCALSDGRPRGAQLRCSAEAAHGLCAGCAADAWGALAKNLAAADRTPEGTLPCPFCPAGEGRGGFSDEDTMRALCLEPDTAGTMLEGIRTLAFRKGRAAAASAPAPTNVSAIGLLAEEASMLPCPGGCGASYAMTEACQHATCDECGTTFGSCCFGHVNSEDVTQDIKFCPLNLTPGRFTDESRKLDQVAICRAVRANRLLARNSDLAMNVCFGESEDQAARAALKDLGLILESTGVWAPARVLPMETSFRVSWALAEVALGREPDPAGHTGLAVKDLIVVMETLKRATFKRLWPRDQRPASTPWPVGSRLMSSGADLLRIVRTLFALAPARASCLPRNNKTHLAWHLRTCTADAVVKWMADGPVKNLKQLQPPWFAEEELELARAVVAWTSMSPRFTLSV